MARHLFLLFALILRPSHMISCSNFPFVIEMEGILAGSYVSFPPSQNKSGQFLGLSAPFHIVGLLFLCGPTERERTESKPKVLIILTGTQMSATADCSASFLVSYVGAATSSRSICEENRMLSLLNIGGHFFFPPQAGPKGQRRRTDRQVKRQLQVLHQQPCNNLTFTGTHLFTHTSTSFLSRSVCEVCARKS